MLADTDWRTLQDAGIAVDKLASVAAAFIRQHPLYSSLPAHNALSAQEEAFLKQGGALGVGEPTRSAYAAENVTVIAGEYAHMITTALTQQQAAEQLGVTTSRIRQRIDNGTLYAIESPNGSGRVCPAFQFCDTGLLPNLDAVLAAIRSTAHPVLVQRFFLTENADLESELLSRTLSPRDWLLTGHTPETVIQLAKDL